MNKQQIIGVDTNVLAELVTAQLDKERAEQQIATKDLATLLGIYDKELRHYRVRYSIRKELLLKLQTAILSNI